MAKGLLFNPIKCEECNVWCKRTGRGPILRSNTRSSIERRLDLVGLAVEALEIAIGGRLKPMVVICRDCEVSSRLLWVGAEDSRVEKPAFESWLEPRSGMESGGIGALGEANEPESVVFSKIVCSCESGYTGSELRLTRPPIPNGPGATAAAAWRCGRAFGRPPAAARVWGDNGCLCILRGSPSGPTAPAMGVRLPVDAE